MVKTIEQMFLLVMILLAFSIFYKTVEGGISEWEKVKKLRYVMERLNEWKEIILSESNDIPPSSGFTMTETILDEKDGLVLKKVKLEYHDNTMNENIEFLTIDSMNSKK